MEEGNPYYNPNAGYDDALMVNMANSIADFHWLGAYSNVTLLKGPFFRFFLLVVNGQVCLF